MLTPTDSWQAHLKQFNHIDYRNCRCSNRVNCIYWKLYSHVKNTKNIEQLTKFILNYSAGLILTGQSTFATKLLKSTETYTSWHFTNFENDTVNQAYIHILMGDADLAQGYYTQARKNYTKGGALRNIPRQTAKVVCCNTILERLRYLFRGFSNYGVNRISGEMATKKLELAVHMQRLSTIFMLEDRPKVARVMVLQGLRAAFQTVEGFLEKGRIFVTAMEIFRRYGNFDMMESLEAPMMSAIKDKTNWNSAEEMSMLVDVYLTLYENRVLKGKFNEGIEIGLKVMKICNCLRITRVKFVVLPSLIEILVWSQLLNEAVDLLRELYYSSKEDIDCSAITWYYALSLELLLDAGMVLESYETCLAFHSEIVGGKARVCVLRDPESLIRLTTCLAIWQLRMTVPIMNDFILNVDEYIKDFRHDKFSRIYNCVKGLECYLLIVNRRIVIKKSNDLIDHLENANAIVRVLQEVRERAPFVRPFLYLLQSYMSLQHGRKGSSRIFLRRSQKWSTNQGNQLMRAWIMQNRRTWEEKYNNMERYWFEHVSVGDAIRWQEIHSFDLEVWSSIMYPLPNPVCCV